VAVVLSLSLPKSTVSRRVVASAIVTAWRAYTSQMASAISSGSW